MDPIVSEWLNLVVRWIHVIVGIAWIGASFYFNWLLNHLKAPSDGKDEVMGELWALHAGGFFKVEKRRMPPGALPAPLHWFKWEAYWTWISGFVLLVIVYYMGASVYLVDRSVADIGPGTAVAIGIATLVVSWFAYDLLWRSPLAGGSWPATLISLALVVGVAFGLAQVFSGRGAYIHVGAMLGTLMAGNVFRVIMPAQRELVAATEQGREQDMRLAHLAEQRSLHNNYMTLPVLFVMVSNHYPSTYGYQFNWLVLSGLFLIGGVVRYYFNIRHRKGTWESAWMLGAAGAATIALVLMVAPPRSPQATAQATADEDRVAFTTVQAVISHHCAACHAAAPAHEAFDKAPGGVMFDTPEQIRRTAQRILTQAVVSKAMPLGNESGMTQEERDLIGRWIYQGAKTE